MAKYHLAIASGAVLGPTTAKAGVSSLLVKTTVKAAAMVAAGQPASGAIATAPVALMEGVLRAMWWMKVRMCVLVLMSALVAGGALWYTWPAAAAYDVKPSKKASAIQLASAEAEEQAKSEISIAALPPVVVDTIPQSGFNRVDAAKTTAIYVKFSKEMEDGSWSWTQLSNDTFPKLTGKPHYEKASENRQCVLPVKLEPGKTYAIWINSENFHNFRDKSGKAAVPYLLVFETKPATPGR